jgi:hypothetical protein
MHKKATKCKKTQSKWCINKHGASKIIDTFETYQCHGTLLILSCPCPVLSIQTHPFSPFLSAKTRCRCPGLCAIFLTFDSHRHHQKCSSTDPLARSHEFVAIPTSMVPTADCGRIKESHGGQCTVAGLCLHLRCPDPNCSWLAHWIPIWVIYKHVQIQIVFRSLYLSTIFGSQSGCLVVPWSIRWLL